MQYVTATHAGAPCGWSLVLLKPGSAYPADRPLASFRRRLQPDIRPGAPSGPWIQTCYTTASGSTPSKVNLYWRRNGERCGQAGDDENCRCDIFPDHSNVAFALDRLSLNLDGFGRVWQEYKIRPDALPESPLPEPGAPAGADGWNLRSTLYNAMGWKTSISEWQKYPPGTVKATVFSNFDTFGRPGTITAPDTTAVTLSYTGVRQIARTVTVDGHSSITTETYDRQGRLVAVTELAGAENADVITAYSYDIGNGLSGVCANQTFSEQTENCTQKRKFTYDNRGFLTSETLPEVGTNGNGDISYGLYDARGHAHWKHDGVHAPAFDFDRAERLVKISQANADKLPTTVKLKEYSFATANGSGDLANGKLKRAWSKNIALAVSTDPAMTAVVQETYTYGGVAGTVLAKTTAVTVAGSIIADPFSQTFSQTFTSTDLGLLASQSYPTCTASAARVETPGRSVVTTYAAGLPIAVGPYYATAITYHPSGMTDSITHAKRIVTVGAGVVDRQSYDYGPSTDEGSQMAQPARISTEGATLPGTGADVDWDTGTYLYDGAGNITTIGSDTFHYDKHNRLTSATVARFGSESYTFDAFGSLTTAGGINLTTNIATNHLNSTVTGTVYDAAGNLTASGLSPLTTTYVYGPFNQLASVQGPGGNNRSKAYTADGERIFVRDGTTYLVTLRDLLVNVIREYEYNASGWRWKRDNIFWGGLLLASETRNEGIKHYHLDFLGSPRLVTNRTGEKVTRFTTSPFGKDATATQSTERMHFTGHERDLGSLSDTLDDIDSMHARSYRAVLGRFTSIDPGRDWDPAKPQSWNIYAYVRNNKILKDLALM